MSRVKKFAIVITIVFSSFACNNDTAKNGVKPIRLDLKKDVFHGIPQDLKNELFEADVIDIIFYKFSASTSLHQQVSIKSNVSYISQDAQTFIPPSCTKPFGRLFYGKMGDVFIEAEIYYSDSCQFFVFMVNEEAKYANKMSNDGVRYYQSMITRALENGLEIKP